MALHVLSGVYPGPAEETVSPACRFELESILAWAPKGCPVKADTLLTPDQMTLWVRDHVIPRLNRQLAFLGQSMCNTTLLVGQLQALP